MSVSPSSLVVMPAVTFTNLINKGMNLYREGKYWESYLLMSGHADHEPRNDAQVYDFRASLACRAGRADLGRQLLEEAILEKGCWYARKYLIEDDDIRPATLLPGFQRLLDVCAEREKAALANAKSELVIVRGKGDERRPLIIMLHGNVQNAAIAREDWNAAIEAGHDMAFVQSSQISYYQAYLSGTTSRRASGTSKAAYGQLKAQGELDGRDVIIAGFSAGGRLALYAMLNDIVDVKGAILVGPWLPEIEEWLPRCPHWAGRGYSC